MASRYKILAFLLALNTHLFSQEIEVRDFHVYRTTSKIVLDGKLEEEAWRTQDSANTFYLNSPNDTAAVISQTLVKMVFDDKFIYIGARMWDTTQRPFVVQSLRRDWGFGGNDNFSVYFDTYDDKTNGFTFGTTPFGVQREGTVFFGQNVAEEWDNVWYLESNQDSLGWTAEFKVPFKSIRYDKKLKRWNVHFLRHDLKNNQVSTWNFVPRQFGASNFSYSGKIHWEDSLPKPGANISIIPYVAARAVRFYDDDSEEDNEQTDFQAGGDVKIGLGPAMNLDLTFNPNFAQVEVDVQQTNLNRFELFFPERRQFFLENADLFSRFGYPNSRVFFSRRIGLQKPIIAGFRLSGKLNENLRIGLLNMQEDGLYQADTNNNYTVAVFQQKTFARSNIQGIFVNRQGMRFNNTADGDAGLVDNDYNRAYGLEYNLFSEDGKWTGDYFLFRSETPGKSGNDWAHGAFTSYQSRNFEIGAGHQFIGENYQLDVGFLPRKGFQSFSQFANYQFYPESNKIVRHGPYIDLDHIFNPNWRLTDRNAEVGYSFRMLNTSSFGAWAETSYIYLQNYFNIGFDPDNQDSLPAMTDYEWNRYGFWYDSDQRKKVTWGVVVANGGFYNAQRPFFRTNIGYRFQPYGSINFNAEYNYLDLEGTEGDRGNWLVGPRLDLTFSRKVFLSTFFQYNQQVNNFNINTRFQYRFAPVSDFFIVYTENYFSDVLKAKNRAIVFKLTYWFNV